MKVRVIAAIVAFAVSGKNTTVGAKWVCSIPDGCRFRFRLRFRLWLWAIRDT
jgi:hypothetical protein